MIALWIFGDFYKISYYVGIDAPFALVFCAAISVLIDLTIIFQFWLYSGVKIQNELVTEIETQFRAHDIEDASSDISL